MIVIPTIDVEATHGSNPFKQLAIGDFGGNQTWGVYRQAEIFNKYKISATFFIDVYEYTMWGEECWREMCRRLIDMGQDVQLHTHPGWRIDPLDFNWLQKIRHEKSYLGSELDLMAKLSFDQQKQVLSHGVELLERWIGQKPIAHRSGGYSIDQNTIKALKDVGIPIDSSMNVSHPNSIVTWSNNAIVENDGVIELPITIGQYVTSIGINPLKFPFYKRLMKTGLDIFSVSEFCEYAIKNSSFKNSFMNLFMHSYSFVNIDKGYDKLKPEPNKVKRLEKTLRLLSEMPNVQFMSCRSFYEEYKKNPHAFHGEDIVPEIQLHYQKMLRYGIKRVSRVTKQLLDGTYSKNAT